MTAVYTLHNIVQRFGSREVLRIPELTLEEHKIYALMGPNGAGKTTLMRILAFLDAPVEGDIAFMGRPVTRDQAAACRSRVVWVPQSPVMFTGSLLHNIEYPMRLKKLPGPERRQRAGLLLEAVDLTRLAKAPAHKLSGGEAQRASIARALAAGAEVLLFDEPTASVDYRSRTEIIEIIRRLHTEQGLSGIITTHDAGLADELCQEKISLIDGRPVPDSPYSGYPPIHVAALPGTCHVFNGKLQREGKILQVNIPPESEPEYALLQKEPAAGSKLIITGMFDQADDVCLRLRLGDRSTVDIRLKDRTSKEMSRKLHLGSALDLIFSFVQEPKGYS